MPFDSVANRFCADTQVICYFPKKCKSNFSAISKNTVDNHSMNKYNSSLHSWLQSFPETRDSYDKNAQGGKLMMITIVSSLQSSGTLGHISGVGNISDSLLANFSQQLMLAFIFFLANIIVLN